MRFRRSLILLTAAVCAPLALSGCMSTRSDADPRVTAPPGSPAVNNRRGTTGEEMVTAPPSSDTALPTTPVRS